MQQRLDSHTACPCQNETTAIGQSLFQIMEYGGNALSPTFHKNNTVSETSSKPPCLTAISGFNHSLIKTFPMN